MKTQDTPNRPRHVMRVLPLAPLVSQAESAIGQALDECGLPGPIETEHVEISLVHGQFQPVEAKRSGGYLLASWVAVVAGIDFDSPPDIPLLFSDWETSIRP